MKEYFIKIVPFALFVFITIVIFKPYFINNKVPFPSNLLMSYYEPFISYPAKEYPSGPPNKPIGFDNLRIYYPLRMLTDEAFRQFSWPLWNPYDFSGNTQLATYQSAVFHPLSFLFFLLPQIDAWSVVTIFSPLLGMLLMYLFLRELSLGKRASVFGAIGLGLSGFVIVNTEELFLGLYSALFLPLICYGIVKSYKKYSWVSFSAICLGTAFSILSGWFQMTFYCLIIAFLYSCFCYFKTKKHKAFLLTLLAIVLGVLISAIHVLPSVEAYLYSARSTTDARFLFSTYLVPWYHLITYVAPDFFGNPASYNYFGTGFYFEKVLYVALPILLFGLYGIFINFKNRDGYTFFSVAWLVTLVLGFSSPISWFVLYSLHLPFIATMLPSRIFFLSTFCLIVLAAYGIEQYLKKVSLFYLLLSLASIGIIFAGGWKYILANKSIPNPNLAISYRNLLLPTLFYGITFFIVLFSKLKAVHKYLYYMFLLLVMISGVYLAQKYFYFSERQFVFPQVSVIQKLEQVAGNDRVWSFGPAYIERNFLAYYHLQSPEGYDSISIQRYSELLAKAMLDEKYVPKDISRADAVLLSGQSTSEVAANPFRLKMLSLLGVKYIVGANTEKSDKAIDHVLLRPIWHDNKFIIYAYQKAYPRAFIVDSYRAVNGDQKILQTVFSSSTDLSKTIILEKQVSFVPSEAKLAGNASLVVYKPNAVTINTQTNKQAFLFLSDNYYPGWQAFVDGKETQIYRADYSFRSIVIPSGKHTVTFIYKPESFMLGLFISIVSIVLLGIICMQKSLMQRFRRKGI